MFGTFVVPVLLHFCCCRLMMYVGWLGFMVLLRWVAFFPMVSVVWSLPGYCIFCYLLSSNRDDSFQKTYLTSFCRANRARTVCTCMCLFCFLSKIENNNGSDIICLNSFPFDYKRVASIHFTVVFRVVFLGVLV